MWNYLRSYVAWLHESEHVARFQQYFGVLPNANQQPDLITSLEKNHWNRNNNNNNNNSHVIQEDEKTSSKVGVQQRRSNKKPNYDSNVLDECMEEMRHSSQQSNDQAKLAGELDYRITSWFWYYFFQFGAALGNEIFYILFFPTW